MRVSVDQSSDMLNPLTMFSILIPGISFVVRLLSDHLFFHWLDLCDEHICLDEPVPEDFNSNDAFPLLEEYRLLTEHMESRNMGPRRAKTLECVTTWPLLQHTWSWDVSSGSIGFIMLVIAEETSSWPTMMTFRVQPPSLWQPSWVASSILMNYCIREGVGNRSPCDTHLSIHMPMHHDDDFFRLSYPHLSTYTQNISKLYTS